MSSYEDDEGHGEDGDDLYIQAGRKEKGGRRRSPYIESILLIPTRGKRKIKVSFTRKLFHPVDQCTAYLPTIACIHPFLDAGNNNITQLIHHCSSTSCLEHPFVLLN